MKKMNSQKIVKLIITIATFIVVVGMIAFSFAPLLG